MYTVRILNNERTLLGVLPVLSWKYNNRFNEASEFSITVARTLEPELSLDSEAYTLIEPHLPAVQEESPARFIQPNVYLSYYLQLYKGSELVAMGQVAKRDFSTNTVSIKAHTEEFELSKYSCPSDYSRCYDGMDICDLARDVTRAWRTSRVKAKSEWDGAVASSGIDTSTEPSVVLLAKYGTAYVSSGYITLEFSRPFQWDRWERIRWSGDSEAPVYTTMAYRTYNGSVWTSWTAETEGAYPAELGVEIADTSAQKVQVRITLSTDDTTSEDDSGNPVGVTPRLFAVEVISRTAPMLTVSGDASSGVLLEGVEANEKSALQILQDAFELYGWEFYVLDGTLYIAEAFGSELGRLFRNGTNIDIHQLSDGLDDVYNVLKAKGQGSGINRPMVELSDAESILEYGVIEHVEEYDTSDITELTSLATADLTEHKDAKPTWKLNTLFPYGEEPDFGIGDIVKVADPNTGIVSTTRIEQEIRSYSGGKLDIECYLGVVRLDLVPRRNPQYRDTVPIERPITVRAIGGFKSIIVSVTKPLRLWETTEVYVSTTSGFTPSAGTLVSSQRSTQFELTNLTAGTRYYIKARHVKTDGEYSSFSDEASAVPTMAQAEDLDIRIGFGIADNSPSAGKVRIHGIDASGQPTNDNGWIRSGSGSLVVPYSDITLIDNKQNFLVLSGGVITPCWFDPNTNKIKNSAGTQVTTGYVIGYAIVSSGSVTDSEAYDNAISISQQINNQSAFILGMLAEAGEAGFADVAEAMGISDAFTSLASYNAFIVNLFAQNATIAGILKSDNYSETDGIPTEGFQLDGPNSIVKMFEAVFGYKCTFYGKLLHSLLQTREAVSSDPITIPTKTHWSEESAFAFINNLGITTDELTPVSGILDGVNLAYAIKATSVDVQLFFFQSAVGPGTYSYSYTCPFTGTLRLKARARSPAYYEAWATVNGVEKVHSYDDYSFQYADVPVTKGDIVVAYVKDYVGGTCQVSAFIILPQIGNYFILANGAVKSLIGYSNKNLTITYKGSTWNSSSNLNYVAGSSILALLTSLSQGMMLGTTGTLVIDGTPRSIVSIFSQASSVLLYWGSTNYKEVLSTGYYDISGTFTPESVTAAVFTDILLPLVSADGLGNGKDIGTPVDRYRAVHGIKGDFKQLLLSGIPTSATGLSSGSVWRDGNTLKIVT